MKWIKLLVALAVCAATAGGVGAALYVIGTTELTPKESLLLGVVLTIGSLLVSWLTTHLYAQASLAEANREARRAFAENMQMYARKAAEKVFNLSGELTRLSDSLSAAISDDEGEENSRLSSVILLERIGAAIHIIQTLKAMNDTFLSDWKTIIGEEIEQQQTLQKQIDALAIELRRGRHLRHATLFGPLDSEALRALSQETEKKINEKLAAMPFKVSASEPVPRRSFSDVECPHCDAPQSVRIRLRKGANKLSKCVKCDQFFTVDGLGIDHIRISPVSTVELEQDCPVCGEAFEERLPEHAQVTHSRQCSRCGWELLVSYGSDGFRTKAKGGKTFPPQFIELVRNALPPSPLPRNIERQLAVELGMPRVLLGRAISKLVEEGVVTLKPAEPSEGRDTQSRRADESP